MSYPYEENMTEAMLSSLIPEQYLVDEARECHRQYVAAKAAGAIRLPAKAANGGDVVHGARMVLYNITDYWFHRRKAALDMLSLERARALEDEFNL